MGTAASCGTSRALTPTSPPLAATTARHAMSQAPPDVDPWVVEQFAAQQQQLAAMRTELDRLRRKLEAVDGDEPSVEAQVRAMPADERHAACTQASDAAGDPLAQLWSTYHLSRSAAFDLPPPSPRPASSSSSRKSSRARACTARVGCRRAQAEQAGQAERCRSSSSKEREESASRLHRRCVGRFALRRRRPLFLFTRPAVYRGLAAYSQRPETHPPGLTAADPFRQVQPPRPRRQNPHRQEA